MKNAIKIIILIIFFSSCKNEEKLNGTWIGAYSYSTNTISDTIYSTISTIITFDDNQYFAEKFEHIVEEEKGKFKLNQNELYLIGDNNYKMEIQSINSDSLIFKGNMGGMNSVYRKLNPKLKIKSNTEIKLIGNVFAINIKNITDTIYFENDSTLIRKSDKRVERWERIKHKEFDLIFVGLSAPWIIRKQNDRYIFLTSYYRTENEFKLRKLNKNVW